MTGAVIMLREKKSKSDLIITYAYMRELGISEEVTNVNGGAIAMGHPLGATGGMLVSTVLDELERRELKRAMISLCVGGGMGISTIIEKL